MLKFVHDLNGDLSGGNVEIKFYRVDDLYLKGFGDLTRRVNSFY